MDAKALKVFSDKRSHVAFTGAEKVAQSKKLGLNSKKTQEVLSSIRAYATHKPLLKRFPRRLTMVPTLNYQVGADLIEVKYPRSNFNKRYILAIVDHFSRKAWLESLKNKSADVVLQAIQKIFNRGKISCRFFFSDKGKGEVKSSETLGNDRDFSVLHLDDFFYFRIYK